MINEKPTIYNAPSVYNLGCGGGNGFKDFLLTASKTVNQTSDGWVINGGVASTSALSSSPPTFSCVCRQDVDISSANILEIEFAFKQTGSNMNNIFFYDRSGGDSRIAIGWLSGSYTFGVFDWDQNINVFFGSFSISIGQKYKVKYKYDFTAQTLEQYVNDNLLQTDSIAGLDLHKTAFAPTWGHRGGSFNLLVHGLHLYLNEVLIKGDGAVLFTGAS